MRSDPTVNPNMKKHTLLETGAALLLAALITSCSSAPKGTTTEGAIYKTGVPGGIFISTFETKAVVTAIDPATRKITLANEAGKERVFTAGPEMVNFDQLRVGDQVTTKVIQQAIVAMATDASAQDDSVSALAAAAPEGAKPGALLAASVQVTAKVTAIDLKNRTATLQLADGSSETFPVRKDIDLTQRKVGEEVSIRVVQAIEIEATKP